MVFIKIGDETYRMKLGINAMVEYEEVTGKSMASLDEDISLSALRSLFHVVLKGGNPNYAKSVSETGKLMEQVIEEHGMEYLGKMLKKAANESMGKSEPPVSKMKKKKKGF